MRNGRQVRFANIDEGFRVFVGQLYKGRVHLGHVIFPSQRHGLEEHRDLCHDREDFGGGSLCWAVGNPCGNGSLDGPSADVAQRCIPLVHAIFVCFQTRAQILTQLHKLVLCRAVRYDAGEHSPPVGEGPLLQHAIVPLLSGHRPNNSAGILRQLRAQVLVSNPRERVRALRGRQHKRRGELVGLQAKLHGVVDSTVFEVSRQLICPGNIERARRNLVGARGYVALRLGPSTVAQYLQHQCARSTKSDDVQKLPLDALSVSDA
mmetsp:Transcript_3363/g.8302  ORF Transcript_3363/g.8302 Transcript_3363/m.8302 type:complete len:263 (-) Transcript_3363:2-790(-)